MSRPQMRASFVRENLEAAEALPEAERGEVLGRFDPELAAAVRGANDNDWLDLDVDVQLTFAIHEVIGAEGLRELNRRAILSSFERPLLGPLFSSAVRLFGPTPMALLRWAPRAFSSVYRHAGYWRVDPSGEGPRATVVWGSLPDALIECAPYLDGVCGALEGAALAVRHEPEVHLELAAELRAASFHLAWRRA